MTAKVDINEVTAILWEAVHSAIMPRFRALSAEEISEKEPGELVTTADQEAEVLVSRQLAGLVPGAPIVGEEVCSRRPDLVDRLTDAPWAWLVDPIDGTANFVSGSTDWAVMVALVRSGTAVAAWIVRPTEGSVYIAEQGSGAWRDGERLQRPVVQADPRLLRGAVLTRFLDQSTKAAVELASCRFQAITSGSGCAGVDYALIVESEQDFAFFHRVLPWDHAPGALLLTEAGAAARRLDGSEYRAGRPGSGLLAAANIDFWHVVRGALPV